MRYQPLSDESRSQLLISETVDCLDEGTSDREPNLATGLDKGDDCCLDEGTSAREPNLATGLGKGDDCWGRGSDTRSAH